MTSEVVGRAAVAGVAGSILTTAVIGLLGPSAMVPALTGPGWQPPYALAADPAPGLVVGLAVVAIVLGGCGLLAALSVPVRALPDARKLVLLGCCAAGFLAFLPPSGSADHLNYAAYGRMVTLGMNPYAHGAVDLPGDPIADAVEEPWREEPTVYGPLATAVHALASWAGGDSPRLTVFVLALVNAAAFIATGLLVDRFTRDDPARRRRAALLWTANPLLLYQLVAGMHADTLAVACVVAALIVKDRPVGAGVLLGAGVAVKLNAGIVALGPAWELRRRPGRLAVMAGSAVAVAAAGYAVVGAAALEPLTRSSKSVSLASMWDPVKRTLQAAFGPGGYRAEIQVASLLLLALLAWLMIRMTGEVAAAIAVAYVFTAPYVLPWYDALAFGMLALVAASAVDRFVVAHLTALSLAYLPARVEGQPPDLLWLRDDLRPLIGWVSLALALALAGWARRAAGPVRRRPASAAPPRSAP